MVKLNQYTINILHKNPTIMLTNILNNYHLYEKAYDIWYVFSIAKNYIQYFYNTNLFFFYIYKNR